MKILIDGADLKLTQGMPRRHLLQGV